MKRRGVSAGVEAEQVLKENLINDVLLGIPTGLHRLPCECGHARVDHVDPQGRWFDGPCQIEGCECTGSGYIAQ